MNKLIEENKSDISEYDLKVMTRMIKIMNQTVKIDLKNNEKFERERQALPKGHPERWCFQHSSTLTPTATDAWEQAKAEIEKENSAPKIVRFFKNILS